METYLLEDETFLLYRFCIACYICMKHFFYTVFALLATFAAQKSFIVCAIKIVIP